MLLLGDGGSGVDAVEALEGGSGGIEAVWSIRKLISGTGQRGLYIRGNCSGLMSANAGIADFTYRS